MSDLIDLETPTQTAVFTVLKAAIAPNMAAVFQHLPENTNPPFLKIGAIDSENVGGKGEQAEKLSLEIIAVYRGPGRAPLLAMMAATKRALHGADLEAAGVILSPPRFITSAASDAAPSDGVTYAGIVNFQIYAEPA